MAGRRIVTSLSGGPSIGGGGNGRGGVLRQTPARPCQTPGNWNFHAFILWARDAHGRRFTFGRRFTRDEQRCSGGSLAGSCYPDPDCAGGDSLTKGVHPG